jgi:predicted RNA-binding Zn-ribbon protein involved in translation (DUF1610 family)
MSSVKPSMARCRHCDTSFRMEVAEPGAKITCPNCGRAITVASANSQAPAGAPKPNLSDDDVLGFLGALPVNEEI